VLQNKEYKKHGKAVIYEIQKNIYPSLIHLLPWFPTRYYQVRANQNSTEVAER